MIASLGRVLMSKGAFFLYGTLVGPLVGRSVQPTGSMVRGAAKSVIKAALTMGGTVQKAVVTAKEGLDDIAAEAKAELSHDAGGATTPAGGGTTNSATKA
jgi:hypothetical protein